MLASIFRVLSATRKKRIFHPVGDAYEGAILFSEQAEEIFGKPTVESVPVVVRISRAFDVPKINADFFGIALRIQFDEQSQDLLFASTGSGRVSKFVFKPAVRLLSNTFGMGLPYKIDKKRYLFWVQLDERIAFDSEVPQLSTNNLLRLQVSRLVGPRKSIGTITLKKKLPQSVSKKVRFNPWNALDTVEPTGLINRLRRRAYVQSQIGRSNVS